ncbi:MAG: phosphatase PAP2 family protein [Bauldia sp.]
MRTSVGAFVAEDWVKVAIIATITAVDAVWVAKAGYRFDWSDLANLAVLLALLLLVAELYRRWRPNPKFVIMTRETAWLVAFTACAALLSNLATTRNFPLVDPALAAAGHFVGFSWIGWYNFVTTRPLLSATFSAVYTICLPQVAFAVVALSLLDRLDRARELVLAAMIGCLVAIAISTVFPSAGALAYFHHDLASINMPTVVNLDYKQAFFDLRAGRITDFSLNGLKGLIAFPSYHATLGVLAVFAFRGIHRFFWPMAALNLVMLAATPVEGGHYSVDVIGGVVVAAASLALASAVRRMLAAAASRDWTPAMAPVREDGPLIADMD